MSDELERLARLATDGPWKWDGCRLRSPGGYAVLSIGGGECAGDTAFIAAASPDVILALLSERRELVELLADTKFYLSRQDIKFGSSAVASMWSQCNPGLQERIDKALAARIAPNQDGEK